MAAPDQSAIREALKAIKVGESDIVTLGMVSDIFVADGKAFFSLTVPAADAERLEPQRQAAQDLVASMDGIKSAIVALTAERAAGSGAPTPPPAQPKPMAQPKAPAAAPAQSTTGKPGIPGVKHVIAVASGKGGVGKSTTSINLALGLQKLGLKVGILDADIYGPSLPRLLGLRGKPETADGKVLKPMEAYGLKAMSMGFLVDEETPMIWRGPMVMSALTQMLREVAWAPLDVLVVDMPPGTGDAQLTMAQQVPLAGAVIVSTPQDLALIDARKGLAMFRKTDVPILGIVENMSYFIAPDTGNRYDIFGHGGAKNEAARVGVPFLGEVPLDMDIRANSDAGIPTVVQDPDGAHAKIYCDIAAKIAESLENGDGTARSAPAINFQ